MFFKLFFLTKFCVGLEPELEQVKDYYTSFQVYTGECQLKKISFSENFLKREQLLQERKFFVRFIKEIYGHKY